MFSGSSILVVDTRPANQHRLSLSQPTKACAFFTIRCTELERSLTEDVIQEGETSVFGLAARNNRQERTFHIATPTPNLRI